MTKTGWSILVVVMTTAAAARAGMQQPAPVKRVDVLSPGYVRPIEMHDTVWMADLTVLEVRDLIKGGATTAIICSGGMEENGPYLVLDKHNLECKAVAEAIARKLGHTLVAPIVAMEPGDPERATPGSPVLHKETYMAIVTDMAGSLKTMGFKHIVLLGDHGGDLSAMQQVSKALNAKWKGEGATLHFVDKYGSSGPNSGCCGHGTAVKFQEDVLGVHEQDEGFHADYENTSVIMTLDVNGVRLPERIKAKKTTTNGIDITPIAKTIENGKKIIAFRADRTAEEIRRLIALPWGEQ